MNAIRSSRSRNEEIREKKRKEKKKKKFACGLGAKGGETNDDDVADSCHGGARNDTAAESRPRRA